MLHTLEFVVANTPAFLRDIHSTCNKLILHTNTTQPLAKHNTRYTSSKQPLSTRSTILGTVIQAFRPSHCIKRILLVLSSRPTKMTATRSCKGVLKPNLLKKNNSSSLCCFTQRRPCIFTFAYHRSALRLPSGQVCSYINCPPYFSHSPVANSAYRGNCFTPRTPASTV